MSDNNNNTIKPRADIGMDMDPGMLLPHVEVMKPGTPGNIVLETARSAMTVMYRETALMLDARKAAYAKQSSGDIQALQRGMKSTGKLPPNAVSDGARGLSILLENGKELNQAFDLSFKRAATAFDAAMSRANETYETIVQSVADRITDPAGTKPALIAAASETRALLRTMQPSERGQLIRNAIEAGDIATAHAVLSVAPFLSGMDVKEQAGIKMLVEKKFAPDQVSQREASVAVLQKMRNASSLFVDKYSKMKVPVREEENTALAALRKGVA